ncbi:MAG: phosphonate ABC transporter, permease protein PhnE [Anaerolineae bacterium]|nr:phosphonate ABC transporter, permease protein PhnE [Anaerolineae bacterium]MDH7472579.1 phosphonate ABC transporter, permease protein PhnE [Anaerolineae bacterium]
MAPTTKRPSNSSWLNVLSSLLVPGLGQVLQGERTRGISLFATVIVLAGLIIWQSLSVLFIPLAALWLWGVWDTLQRERGRPSGPTAPFLLAALIVYAAGIKATEIVPRRIITGWPNIQPIVHALVRPELLKHPTEDRIGYLPLQVPCIEPLPEPGENASQEPRLHTNVRCAGMGETIILEGEGFFPEFETEIWWRNPIGDWQKVIKDGIPLTVVTDAEGRFQVSLQVPTTAVPLDRLPGPGETQTHRVEARQHKPYGSLQPTQTLSLVLNKIGETIALAFIATVLAVIFALPVSLLASRNLMWGNPASRAVYYAVRAVLNIVRSVETLMWAIIFVVWVGQGPYAGTLALLLHSIAALGKLYSEAIEGIDPGPIEAIRATGATWSQVVVYAVLPQFMPSFLSFTLYRWDINVRMSTVIGLVCDAGLGFLVIQWIRLSRYNAMATAIIAIVLVVAILDYVSAFLRQRVIEGVPSVRRRGWFRRYAVPAMVTIALLALFVWSWQVAQIDIATFVTGIPDGLRLASRFFPELITRPTEEVSVSAALPVPCGAAEPTPQPPSGPRVNLSLSCASPGDPLVITGHELPPNTRVSVRWLLPDGRYLRIQKDCCDTDSMGNFRLETKVHPLLEVNPQEEQIQPGGVAVVWKQAIGGPRPSEALTTTFNLSLVTLLMALIATTLGSVVAIPVSFFAARNVMGRSIVGQAIYNFSRTVFNLWRSIEPMILAVISASWLGFGPFAGVVALALNNIPNLAKLFSEAIEEIDAGPVEAITATGANRLQTLVYAVVPQLIPRFLAYILYQWDINIRMSTVIGYVGGGGIGQQFRTWVELDMYEAAGAAVLAIVVMVWSMDYISGRVREKMV